VNDQRQHPRYAIELDSIIITEQGDVNGRSRDLSRGGLSMLAPEAVALGTACRIKIALVFSETEFSEHLDLPATVVWCTKVQDSYQLGVKFAPLEPQVRSYLDMFMKFLEGGDEEEDDADEDTSSEFDGE
jgi:hypothetical protein